uniref:Uncharacterized protein n=1 Tax=Physcomitrium patens TaxID=3218 RepID=A0A2K1JUV9_PHYPA|nr:hypothetical protein PHYPA_015081 [Physcomitrium patens]
MSSRSTCGCAYLMKNVSLPKRPLCTSCKSPEASVLKIDV